MTVSWNDEELTRLRREQDQWIALVTMLLNDLPAKRDWLDPDLEKWLREKAGRPTPTTSTRSL